LPPDVLAVEATGKVTHLDYRDTLIPKAEAMMAKGPVRMLYVIGKEFTGFELEALWDDSAFGFKHWHDFSRIAVEEWFEHVNHRAHRCVQTILPRRSPAVRVIRVACREGLDHGRDGENWDVATGVPQLAKPGASP
jgi:hypothetical protein